MTHQEKIDEVMDWFDFRKVAKAMAAVEWWWWNAANGVPTEAELRQSARHKLQLAIECGYCGSGGFEAKYEEGVLTLDFVLATHTSGDSDE